MKPCISQATTLSTPFEADLDVLRAGRLVGGRALADQAGDVPRVAPDRRGAGRSSTANGLQAVAAASQGGLLLSPGRRAGRPLGPLPPPARPAPASWTSRRWSSRPTSSASSSPEDYGRAAESLAEAAGLARAAGVRLALEFQKGSRFCSSLDTALALIAQSRGRGRRASASTCSTTTPGRASSRTWPTSRPENLAWVQVCDLSGVPRELAGDADRILPGEGDFQIGPILDHLAAIGYDGFVSLEVLNPQLWAIPADRVADAGRQAMERLLARPDLRRRANLVGRVVSLSVAAIQPPSAIYREEQRFGWWIYAAAGPDDGAWPGRSS